MKKYLKTAAKAWAGATLNVKRFADAWYAAVSKHGDEAMEAFRPDVIVINLGTNDLSWCAGRPERCTEYRKGYAEFLKTVRKNNPESRIQYS